MIKISWLPGCYGSYVMQSIYAYSNFGNGKIVIDPTGSSHSFRERSDTRLFFDHSHEWTEDTDVHVNPVPGHELDYLNNQLVKQNKNDVISSFKRYFGDEFANEILEHWGTTSHWAIREWASFCIVDQCLAGYKPQPTVKVNQQQWIAQQRYHNSQHRCKAWVEDILNDRNTATPCQTLLDEAYVQHCLREQGYEIHCDGLDNFPKTSSDLREIIYENSNTNN